MKKKIILEFRDLFGELDQWFILQINHQKVTRWDKQRETDSNLRPQTNLQHIASVIDVATRICLELRLEINFDIGLVLSAFNVHEHGEALLLRDVLYDVKNINPALDAEEYTAFRKSSLDGIKDKPKLILELQKAFLLQFVTKKSIWNSFPHEAQLVLEALEKENSLEAKIFNAIERYEYILYCLEFKSLNNKSLLQGVLQNQVTHLDLYAAQIPGFNKIWTGKKSELSKALLN